MIKKSSRASSTKLLSLTLAALVGCAGGDEPQPVELAFSLSVQAVEVGDEILLTWDAKNATTCAASGGWTGAKSVAGTERVVATSVGTSSFALECRSGASAVSKDQSVTISPATKISRTVSARMGGLVELPNIAAISIKSGLLESDTQVVIQQTRDAKIQSNFVETASIFAASNASPYEVRFEVGSIQPTQPVAVIIKVPTSITQSATPSQEVRGLYLNVYQEATVSQESMELLPERGSINASELWITLPQEAFYLAPSGRYEAHMLLALTETAQTSAPASPNLLPTDSRAFALATTADPAAGKCLGKSIGSPVDPSFVISSRFGSRSAPRSGASTNHKGIDYATPVGTSVYAVSDGRISKVNIDSGNINLGYGYYVELTHTDGSVSRYGHLTEGSAPPVGTTVNRGDIIAKTGNTGSSTAPHLHFEYSPNGKTHINDGRVDPAACMGATVRGSLIVFDNGHLADDSFELKLNGVVVCRTSIGESNNCAVGALRTGLYSLVLRVLIAPDDEGTYEILSNEPRILINGQSSVSGYSAQGTVVSFTLTVK